jgi:hypothetical protein
LAFAAAPRTAAFQLFCWRLTTLAFDEPNHKALYTLLSLQAARYIGAFDEEPVPISVADRAYGNLLRLVASLNLAAPAEGQLNDLNRIAATDLLDPSSATDFDPAPHFSSRSGIGLDGQHRLDRPALVIVTSNGPGIVATMKIRFAETSLRERNELCSCSGFTSCDFCRLVGHAIL